MTAKGPEKPPPPRRDDVWPEGTYLEWRLHLYEVVGWEAHETEYRGVAEMLHVTNCLTDHPLWLSLRDLKEATPVRTTPDAPPEDWRVEAAA